MIYTTAASTTADTTIASTTAISLSTTMATSGISITKKSTSTISLNIMLEKLKLDILDNLVTHCTNIHILSWKQKPFTCGGRIPGALTT